MFQQTATLWHQQCQHPTWAGLQLLAVDGVVWRTPDTPDNAVAFAKSKTVQGETHICQVPHVVSDGADQSSADTRQ